jgi:hypothetical protein
MHINAKVSKIDTIDYYIVVKARALKSLRRYTILSPVDEKSQMVLDRKDSCRVTVGAVYSFVLQPTNRIKNGEESYFLVNLKRFYYGNLKLLDEGEVPYIALNMYKDFLFNY